MTIEAKIIEDSISSNGTRLTTFQLKYPRIVHSEFMTHRDFSRNASSSRAVPVKRTIRDILDDPAAPSQWGSNQKGMQAGQPLSGMRLKLVRGAWYMSRYPAVGFARLMILAGAHKQIANRILEPWSHISVLVTATRWNNFYALRCHPDADPTIYELACLMRDVHMKNKPVQRDEHLPYLNEDERSHPERFKLSAARCARVSYLNHDGTKPSVEADLSLYARLMGNEVKHASPTEHQAIYNDQFKNLAIGNLDGGWCQFRKSVQGEYVK